jgi:hypothetical protein
VARKTTRAAVRIGTNGHLVSDLESQTRAAASKDHCRAIWKTREMRKLSRRRLYDCPSPLGRCHSNRPEKTLSSACSSRSQAPRRVHCGRRVVDRLHQFCHPSASLALSGCRSCRRENSTRAYLFTSRTSASPVQFLTLIGLRPAGAGQPLLVRIAASHYGPQGSGARRHWLITSGICVRQNSGPSTTPHGTNSASLMSAMGHKRTSRHVRLMSALPPKADIG